jgi:alpha-galactosidase
VVTEYGADYIKFDHNIDPGIGTEVDSDSYGDGLLEHCRALVKWKNDIRKKYPNLIMESCSSGGMRTDYLTLSTGFLQSVSDQQEAIINTLLSSACPTALLPEQCGMWAYPQPVHTENDVITAMVNVLMLRPYISGKLHLCAEKSRQLVKEGLSLYKEIRGDVSKAIPFYPLGLTKYSDKFFCTGYKCDDKTYLCVWNIDEKDIEKVIPLENAKQAKILYPSVCNYAEAKVAADGIKVKLEKNTAVFLEIR